MTTVTLIDLVTITFEGIFAACVVFTAGYALNGKGGSTLAAVRSFARLRPVAG